MATQVQFRRDTRTNLLLSTPVEGEIGVDTTNDRLILGDGSTAGGLPQASFKDVQNNLFTSKDAGGTANAITLDLDDAPAAYVKYQQFIFDPTANNTSATTINVNSLGLKDIQKDDGSGTLVALEADDLKQNIPATIVYDGTRFILQLGGGQETKGFWTFVETITLSSDASATFTVGANQGYRLISFGLETSAFTTIFLRWSSTATGSFFNSGYSQVATSGPTNTTYTPLATGADVAFDVVVNYGGVGTQQQNVFYKGKGRSGGGVFNYSEGISARADTNRIDGLQVSLSSGVFNTGDIHLYTWETV